MVATIGWSGKGYLVDIISRLLIEQSIAEYCINAGGDIYHYSASHATLSVGLEHPDDSTLAVGVVKLGNQAMCASAPNRRVWGAYHHILDPRSLKSPSHIKAVWTVAGLTMVADGLATALFFVPPKTLQAAFEFEYLIIHSDDSFSKSASFPARLFTEDRKQT